MMSTLARLFKNARELPLVVSILCHGYMVVGPLMLLFMLIPFFDWEIDGRMMTYHELWNSGTFIALVLVLIMATAGAWGMAARVPWARWVLVLMQPAMLLALALFPSTQASQESLSMGDLTLQTLVMSLCVYACLFHLPGMRRYYSVAVAASQE